MEDSQAGETAIERSRRPSARMGPRMRRATWRALILVQALMLTVSLAVPAGILAVEEPAAYVPSGPPTIASDKADYAPGETVTLTGTNWAAGEAVRIVVNDTYGASWVRGVTVTATDTGAVTDVFPLPSYFVSDYDVTATGPISGTATSTFTDLGGVLYDQCSNDDGDGYGGNPGTCQWINGNLNGQNSTYPEGDATVQRLWLTDFVPGTPHSVTFEYGTTKGGKHAYDYLTTWSWSENWIAVADRCATIDGCTTANETTLAIPDDPNVTDIIEPAAGPSRLFTMRGGAMVSATAPAIVSGTYAGDSETAITISFTVGPSDGSMCSTKGQTTTCAIALWFGAHVARGDQWTAFNGTTGAGSVSGSPYHVKLAAVDGAAAGGRDNQMQASAVVAPPILHLRKIVISDDGGAATVADFTLTADGTSTNDLSGTSPVDSANTLVADTWALSETNVAGYTASAWVCVGGTQVGSNITLASGAEATCTITNTDNPPHLKLVKVVTTDDGGIAVANDWDLTATGSSRTFTELLPGAATATARLVTAGVEYTLSESPNPGTGYSSTGIWSCDGGTFVSPDKVTVALGGNVTCTITNDDQPGTIIIKKLTLPTGSTTSFSFDASGGTYQDFNLLDTQTNTQVLPAGSYTVMEMVPLGWVLTGIGGSTDPNTPYNCTVSGQGGSTGVGDLSTQTATISLKNGDTVTCVFENTGQGVTRTQGFWATHPELARIAWFGGTNFGHTFPGVVTAVGDNSLCGRPIDTLEKLMGGFWSDISKKSVGGKRSALDQARMQLLQQLLAAELNGSAFGSVPGSGSFAAWEAAFCGSNTNAIKTAQQQAASFNTAGDSGLFTPGTSADSKTARTIANKIFWDVLP